VAAVLVVDRQPDLGSLLLLFAWCYFWEIGGQNIPSDWNYTDADARAHARTIPIRYGLAKAGLLIVAALSLSVLAAMLLPLVSPARLGWLYIAASLLIGYFLLLRPGYELYRRRAPALAARLFDRASYYPLAHFLLISTFLLAEELLA
jgi:4-hydroxybenzoate polyprenyltransferase